MNKTLLLSLCLVAISAQAQKPELVLPAIHSTPIMDICFSADNRFMATCAGSEIKLWEQKTGRLLRSIQTPLPVENIALSKDGSRLVCGTFCGVHEYQEERDNKPNINTEVQVWDMVSGKKLRTLKALGKPIRIQYVEIADDGNQAMAIYGGQITLWDARSGGEKWVIEGSGKGDFSPNGTHLMLNNKGTCSWVDCSNGAKTEIMKDSCGLSAFQGDAVVLITHSGIFKRWDPLSKSFSADVATVLGNYDFQTYSSQTVRFSQDGMQLGVLRLNPEGNEEVLQFRSFDVNSGKLLVKQDSMEYDFGRVFLTPDLHYFLTSPLVDVADVRAGMSAYSISTGKFSHYFGLKMLEITTDNNMFTPNVQVYNQGKMIYVNRDSTARPMPNLVFLPERGEAISGVESGFEILYAENETLVEDKRWSVECKDNISYQISDVKTGKLVATLLVPDVAIAYTEGAFAPIPTVSRIWAVTTPSGLFDASPEMMENLHYVFDMEVIELQQLKERYYEPGLLGKLMGFSSGELRNVAAFDNVALYPEIKAKIENNQLKITLTDRSGGIGKLALFVNGKQMNADINPSRQQNLALNLDEFTPQYRSDTANTIGLVAYNGGNWLRSQAYELPYRPIGARGENTGEVKPSECGSTKPHLYLLMIGTSKYNDASKNLSYPDLDAQEMAKALSSTGKVLFDDLVHLKLLSTAGEGVEVSSKANIEKAFKELQKATPCDVLVVYFSGHGSTWGKEGDKTNFYYLTKDITSAKLADDAVRKEYAVSDEDLTKWLAAIPAQKQVLILDACHSGLAAETLSGVGQRDLNSSQVIAFELLKDRTGTFILTGSASDMVSFEASQYGQGLLTYSLLEGISGTALKGGKYVDIMMLFQNARDVVPKLAASIKQVQIPVIAAPKGGSSFPIGIKDASVKINLPQPKPVVIQCNFQDRDNFNDGLGLTQALNDYFHGQTAKGAQARFVYYDIPKFAEGFSIRGNYAISGEQANVAGRLFKGDTPVGEAFQLTGSKDPAALVKLIMKEVGPRISVK
ncbi:MAG: caspase family protein [Saprospiraceae bacterium]